MDSRTAMAATGPDPRAEMLRAAVGLLDDHGPDALQVRKVAAAAGTSTMMVYTHFGGMRGLIAEVAEEGRRQFDAAITVGETDDPVADLITCGTAYRRFAIRRPHLYRLMFGSTSAHGIDAPARNVLTASAGDIEAHYAAFAKLTAVVHRCMTAGRITAAAADDHAAVVSTSAQFWSTIHGYVMLELAGYYGDAVDGGALISVLGRLLANLLVAMGDSPERLAASMVAAGWG
ncbi:MAG: TetR/AcrR family transcriptional regulator [Mycobacterium sp.]